MSLHGLLQGQLHLSWALLTICVVWRDGWETYTRPFFRSHYGISERMKTPIRISGPQLGFAADAQWPSVGAASGLHEGARNVSGFHSQQAWGIFFFSTAAWGPTKPPIRRVSVARCRRVNLLTNFHPLSWLVMRGPLLNIPPILLRAVVIKPWDKFYFLHFRSPEGPTLPYLFSCFTVVYTDVTYRYAARGKPVYVPRNARKWTSGFAKYVMIQRRSAIRGFKSSYPICCIWVCVHADKWAVPTSRDPHLFERGGSGGGLFRVLNISVGLLLFATFLYVRLLFSNNLRHMFVYWRSNSSLTYD
jgi:hypothetical protein